MRTKRKLRQCRQWRKAKDLKDKSGNTVRLEMMLRTGYYITESSEYFSEYCVHFIKNAAPELVPEFNIPLDEYPRRGINQIADWKKMRKKLVDSPDLTHKRSRECIYQSAMLDPHTACELMIDQIHSLCDDLIAAHGNWLPKFR